MPSIDTLVVVLILTNFALLGSSRLAMCIRVMAIQGVVLGLLPLMTTKELSVWFTAMSLGTMALKGIVFPWLLGRAQRTAGANREVEPFVGYTASLLAGIVMLGLSLWLSSRLGCAAMGCALSIPVAFFTILVGLFLIIARKKALTQVLGYLTMENGIYALGWAIAPELPLIVELGVLLDVLVAVFVMGIAIFHISREFDHIDTDKLATLKDWSRRWKIPPVTVERSESTHEDSL